MTELSHFSFSHCLAGSEAFHLTCWIGLQLFSLGTRCPDSCPLNYRPLI
ncbi:hypothetical protein SeF3a_214 [Salmonella phage SeF3a]|nr:hypothetical protein SeF3a_214 [Salmonella phage SeF3a]